MTDLQAQAREYAEERLKRYQNITVWRVDAWRLIVEAYIQGWVDRDTRDMKPETQDEFFNGE